jgi:hypothetical protein
MTCLIITGHPRKIVHNVFYIFCVLALVQEDNLSFHEIEFIVVILNLIDFLSSKRCPRYEYSFYTSSADIIRLASSQKLVNRVCLIVKTHIKNLFLQKSYVGHFWEFRISIIFKITAINWI